MVHVRVCIRCGHVLKREQVDSQQIRSGRWLSTRHFRFGGKQPKTDTPGQEMIPRSRGYMCLKTQMRTQIVWPAVALHRPAISVVRVATKLITCPPAIFIAPQRPINRGSLMYPSRFLKSNSKGWDESDV